jgi:hypothetical protein
MHAGPDGGAVQVPFVHSSAPRHASRSQAAPAEGNGAHTLFVHVSHATHSALLGSTWQAAPLAANDVHTIVPPSQ